MILVCPDVCTGLPLSLLHWFTGAMQSEFATFSVTGDEWDQLACHFNTPPGFPPLLWFSFNTFIFTATSV